jgi:hypothetical protein
MNVDVDVDNTHISSNLKTDGMADDDFKEVRA